MTLKINTTPHTLPSSLAPLSESSPTTGGTSQNPLANHVPAVEQHTLSPSSVAPEQLITDTENSRQSTQTNPTTSKLIGETSNPQVGAVASTVSKPVSVESVVEKAAKTPATPFEVIPAQYLTADEAKAELLALEKNGDIDVEFTEEGKTVLFVPVFDVNFKKETNTSAEVPVKSFSFPQPQEAVSISRLAEWSSLKGIKDILFRGFTSAFTETKTEEPTPPSPPKPSSPSAVVEPSSTIPLAETNASTKPLGSTPTTSTAPAITSTPAMATTTSQTSSAISSLAQTSSAVTTGQTITSPAIPSATPSSTTTASYLLAQGVPKPSSPPPTTTESATKPTFQTVPLMQLQKEIASSSSAVPIQKPLGVPKPSSPHPTAQEPTATSTGHLTREANHLPIASDSKTSVAPIQNDPKTAKTTTSSSVLSPSSVTNASEPQAKTTTSLQTGLAAQATNSLPLPSSTNSSSLSSLGDRLQSLLSKEPTATTSNLSYSDNTLSDLLKGRTSIHLPQMDIAGFRGNDPKTGKVIDVHGYRDMIRFNHHSYLQSVQSHRAEIAREAIQREAQEREQREKTQRHTEQQELRMLIELEQLRRLNTVQPPATSATTSTAPQPPEATRSSNPAEQNPFNIHPDVNAQRLQHHWHDQLNHKK